MKELPSEKVIFALRTLLFSRKAATDLPYPGKTFNLPTLVFLEKLMVKLCPIPLPFTPSHQHVAVSPSMI
ncbi:hypothetical protein D3C75_1330030 [compost metagenome]